LFASPWSANWPPHAQPSAYELAEHLGIIGSVKDGPTDLSANRKHFDGFGES
jgi:hypothetical protein